MLLVTVEDLKINGRQYNRWAFVFGRFYSTNKKKPFCIAPNELKKFFHQQQNKKFQLKSTFPTDFFFFFFASTAIIFFSLLIKIPATPER